MRDLSEIRNEIDSVDAEIVALYEKRMRLAEQVAEYNLLLTEKGSENT